MRFSLATLVLMVLWAGAVMCVWMRREPWVLASLNDVVPSGLIPALIGESPDKTPAAAGMLCADCGGGVSQFQGMRERIAETLIVITR